MIWLEELWSLWITRPTLTLVSLSATQLESRVLFFFIFKKNQNFKNICPFWNISKLPPVALWGATGPKCNFFLQICNEVHDKKKARGPVAPPTGDRGLSPTPGATGACRPLGATGSPPPYISPGRHMPPFPLSFEPKNSGKKRGVRRRKAAKLCRNAYLWSTGNFHMNPLILYKNLI